MCRIAGIINPNLTSSQLNESIQSMCDSMRKGGPDGFGYHIDETQHLAFGHRRLSLIDLTEQGKQPMFYDNETLSITFNGEIYNYQEIKDDLLQQGYTFQNQTDTEVILVGFKAYGTAIFDQLKGMFAFALNDKNNGKTYLVRDHQGIKPLYYSTADQTLVFASEIKAFKAYDANWPANTDWKIYFLAFGFVPEPFTTLHHVKNLTRGHYLLFYQHTNSVEIISYLEKNSEKLNISQQEAYAECKTLLDKAVKRHLIADAPVGVFLSGGIDSSLLSIIAQQQHPKQISTVSINFNEAAFSEQEYQKLIVEQIGSKHHDHLVTPQDFEENISQIFKDMDQPSNDGINSWFVNKYAKADGLKAVLSGIGADELFGGYPSFKRHGIVKTLKKLPKAILKLSKYSKSDKVQRIAYLAYENPVGEYLFLRGFYTPKAIADFLKLPVATVEERIENFPINLEVVDLSAEDRISWFETNIYMQNQLLKDTDYMSMAHGIEVRVPFLDKDLISFAQRLPTNIRFDKKQAKNLLIKAYENILPEAIWNRPKKGFTFPFQHWFESYAPILNEKHYQNNELALSYLEKFKKGKLHWSKLFAIYQLYK